MSETPEPLPLTPGKRLALIFSPPASESEHATGLTFTDILFGFVISQVFLRLQNWGDLQGFVRWQLIVSTVIVLGSWIGFRRSFNRRDYELKFFNLPLTRFILDQAMVLLYFRIATLTPRDPADPVDPSALAGDTLQAAFIVFALYLLWDIGGLVMGHGSKYTAIEPDWGGFWITAFFLAGFAVLRCIETGVNVGEAEASCLLAAAFGLLLAYRWAKEVRSSWREARVAATKLGA